MDCFQYFLTPMLATGLPTGAPLRTAGLQGACWMDTHRREPQLGTSAAPFELLSRVRTATSCVLQDLKANESRLKDINKVAEDLESEGLMAEEVQAVQQQVGVRVLPPSDALLP